MGPFAHPLFSAIMADDGPARPVRRSARPLPTTGTGLATGLNLNPLFLEDSFAPPPEPILPSVLFPISSRRRELLKESVRRRLNMAALVTAPFPGIGDVTGFAADAFEVAEDPSLLNFGLIGLGGLPFVPSIAATKRVLFAGPSKIHDILLPSWNRGADKVTMPVLQNPSRREIAKELKRSGFLRVLRDHQTGDVFMWPGEEALHEEVIRQLGLSDRTENLGQVTSLDDLTKLAE